MAIKKIEMRPRGAGNYADILYPKTSVDMVEGLQAMIDDADFLIQQDAEPSGTEEGRLWLDTSDNTFQGTAMDPHVQDSSIHVSSADRSNWDGKEDALSADRKRKITFGTAEPSGGSDGDIYFQYE